MLSVLDLDALLIEAEATVAEWEQEFQENFNQPLMEAALVASLLEMPPEMAAAFKQSDPELFEKLNEQIHRMKGMVKDGY